MTRDQAVAFLTERPAAFGRLLGFTKLTDLHNGWIVGMLRGDGDETLQAHRGSFKTTCVSIALALQIVLLPNLKTLFMRKTDSDVKEIIAQIRKILESPQMKYFALAIYGVELKLSTANANELSTNLTTDPRGVSQLVAMGLDSSLTGKHFDRIFTDDIVNVLDRISKAEREHTKVIYQELQNIRNPDGGRIINTGTPWHPEDAFTLMPPPRRWDCYSTGLLSKEKLEELRGQMTASLFAANYELRHIAAEDVLFTDPQTGGDPEMIRDGICHIDAAYGGEDYTAFTIARKRDGRYYVYGRLWRRHVDDVIDEICGLRALACAGRIYCEDNGDKGYLAKDLRRRGERVSSYHESTNKFLKITSYLKACWRDVIFVSGTDEAYIRQICDYNEDAEHDDAPDSCASVVRILWRKKT